MSGSLPLESSAVIHVQVGAAAQDRPLQQYVGSQQVLGAQVSELSHLLHLTTAYGSKKSFSDGWHMTGLQLMAPR